MQEEQKMSENNKDYLCFADFEFTCGYYINKYECEILSAGVIICDKDYEVKEKFYCTCRPYRHPKLTKQCRRLTKLTQEEINDSPDSNDVMEIIVKLLKKYRINNIYVWGSSDKSALSSDVKQHQKYRKEYGNIQRVREKIFDIQEKITDKMELPEPVNIKELASAFDYTPTGNFHNALNDALALYVIYKAVCTDDIKSNEKLSEIRRKRQDKLKEQRSESEKKQKDTAFSLPLSEEEKLYYEEIKEDYKKERHYILMRSKIVNSINRNPNEIEFLLIYMKGKRNIKVIPKSKYNYTLQNLSEKAITFERNNFSELILSECRKAETVTI